MKLTINQLRKIIKEEVQQVVSESFEREPLNEATRDASNLIQDLETLPVGERIKNVNLFDFGPAPDGIKGDIEKRIVYALIKLNRRGKPSSEEVFKTADELAYSLGNFSY